MMLIISASAVTLPSTLATPSIFWTLLPMRRAVTSSFSVSPGTTAPILKLAKRKYRTHLCQGLDLQHTRHHRSPGEMPGEKLLIHRHLFDADYAYPRFELDNFVDEKERITVRQYLLNSDGIVNYHYRQYKTLKSQ
jgi:hypothetical protein